MKINYRLRGDASSPIAYWGVPVIYYQAGELHG